MIVSLLTSKVSNEHQEGEITQNQNQYESWF